MDEKMLAKACKTVKDVRVFINGVSRRAAQLARGGRPLVTPPMIKDPLTNADRQAVFGKDVSWLDCALMEVAEGKVTISQGTDAKKEDGDQEKALDKGKN